MITQLVSPSAPPLLQPFASATKGSALFSPAADLDGLTRNLSSLSVSQRPLSRPLVPAATVPPILSYQSPAAAASGGALPSTWQGLKPAVLAPSGLKPAVLAPSVPPAAWQGLKPVPAAVPPKRVASAPPPAPAVSCFGALAMPARIPLPSAAQQPIVFPPYFGVSSSALLRAVGAVGAVPSSAGSSVVSSSVMVSGTSATAPKKLGVPHPLYKVALCEPYTLFPHQEEAIKWIAEKEQNNWHGMCGGIVSLEMGLGKTLISLFTIAMGKPKQITPTLGLCSKSLLSNWRADKNKFFGESLSVLYLHDKEMPRKDFLSITVETLCKYDLVLTTYDVVRNTAKSLLSADGPPADKGPAIIFEMEWHRVVADESQTFANYKGKLLEALMRLRAPRKLCLSGTPVRNYDADLYSQFRFCNFNKVPTAKQWCPEAYRHYKLRHNILMQTYETAKIKLPPKEEKIVHVELKGEERQIYLLFWKLSAMTLEHLQAGTASFGALLANFTRLRQACIAPHLIHPAGKLAGPPRKKKKERAEGEEEQEEEEINTEMTEEDFKSTIGALLGSSKREREEAEMETLYPWLADATGTAGMRSQKINALVSLLREEIPKEDKVIVFSTFASALVLVRRRLMAEGFGIHGCVMVDGTLKSSERETAWNKFRQDPNCKVLLMTYKVGSEGVNLVEANAIICTDAWWAPSVRRQAIARAWRIGQCRKVSVYDIVCERSIEDRIMEVCQKKDELAETYLGSTKARAKGQGIEFLRAMIGPSSAC